MHQYTLLYSEWGVNTKIAHIVIQTSGITTDLHTTQTVLAGIYTGQNFPRFSKVSYTSFWTWNLRQFFLHVIGLSKESIKYIGTVLKLNVTTIRYTTMYDFGCKLTKKCSVSSSSCLFELFPSNIWYVAELIQVNL